MLNKLAVRNAKRSMKDYVIYMITMTLIATLMFAFDSMIFCKSIREMCEDISIMVGMLIISTIVIILIVAWLINYMVRFMLEKRSREFGIYLLLGMKKKQISMLYLRENLFLSGISFLIGGVLGVFLQQIIMSIFYSIFHENYHVKIEYSLWAIIMTIGCYFGCHLLAIFRNRKKFKKMNISDLMRMEKENEKIIEGKEGIKSCFFFLAIIYFIFFIYKLLEGNYSVFGVISTSVGFIVSIYLLYIGLSAFIIRYIKKGRKGIYKNNNLFLLRQIASKLNTMKFTMGTLTVLLTGALLGGTVAMMFGKFQDKEVQNSMPFDILIYSKNPDEDFIKEQETIESQVGIRESLIYCIYQDGTHDMNDYMYTHGSTLGNKYKNSDGSINEKKVADDGYEYCDMDTYISLSDYNSLRKMIGLSEIELSENEYAIQIKKRMKKDLNEEICNRKITQKNEKETINLELSEIYTDNFSQNGINGADYLIIVPDNVANYLTPYYCNMAVSTVGVPQEKLQNDLTEIRHEKNGIMSEKEFEKLQEKGEISEDEIWDDVTLLGCGTDQIVVIAADVLVAKPLTRQIKFAMTSIVFPLIYIGFVFVCVALTILAVQQLSDSNKYKFRYDVLKKLGLNEKEINHLILKQLLYYYMIPGVIALFLSCVISVFTGNNFAKYTGATENGFYYFGIASLLFFSIYVLYFVATYLGFKENISRIKKS